MIERKSPFKRVRVKRSEQVDIETLFRDLKNRSPDIKGLYSFQADILREYYNHHSESTDVSLELPTGTGKTLVGLLIAEWRRRILGQRVLYLCPTKQLVYQVNRLSKDYAINTRVFVGSKRKYDRHDLSQYRSANVIAVSTYSGLFNTSPGINDPQTIILDDAHSAETYVSSAWSLNISRRDEPELFGKVIEIFEKDLSPNLINTIHKSGESQIQSKTEKVPLGAFCRHLPTLRSCLNSNIPNPDVSSLYFSWIAIRDGLEACHIYVSSNEILIRPYIPPTLTHKPFADAKQRVYMSATLGRGGELERITGIREIKRIPTPETFLKRGVGRRFFLFPDLSQERIDYFGWIAKRLSLVDRTLVMCPNNYATKKFLDIANTCSPKLRILTARDIEENLEPFTESTHSILLLTNRYDGIDLPDGVCRQVIIDGLPSRTNLQETFLEERLGLDFLLRERIKTRIEQASGRCTRSDTDSAALIMLSKRLLDFCIRKENQKIFHPEIRAEIRFALEQNNNPAELDKMLDAFMKKNEDWNFAEQDIADLRSSEELPDTSVTDILSSGVKHEVDFAYALWTGDYEKAIISGRKVADGLSGDKVSSYRALWYFLTGSAAYINSKDDKKYLGVSRDLISRAKNVCKTVSWFPHELKFILPELALVEDTDEIQALQVEGIVDVLRDLGSAGPRFNKKLTEVEKFLKSNEAKKFDLGLAKLGELLGFSSSNPSGSAAPDCIWRLGYDILLILEGKSEESPESGISVQNCRQASGHTEWAKSEDDLKNIKRIYSVLITPKTSIDEEAIPHGKNVYVFAISDAIKLFEKVKSVLIESRTMMSSGDTGELSSTVLRKLSETNLTAKELCTSMSSRLVTDLPIG